MIIRNCIWHPLGNDRSIFRAFNDGTHDFGYPCYLPQNVIIEGFTVMDGCDRLAVFNDWTGKPEGDVKYPMIEPVYVSVKDVAGAEAVVLCSNEALLAGTEFVK